MTLSKRCHCQALRRVARSLTNRYDAALAPAGLTVAQFSLLRTLERLGPSTISFAAARLDIERTTLGRNLRPLARAGLIARADGTSDSREHRVLVTPEGRAAIAEAEPLWRTAQADIEASVGPATLERLHSLLVDLEGALAIRDRAQSTPAALSAEQAPIST